MRHWNKMPPPVINYAQDVWVRCDRRHMIVLESNGFYTLDASISVNTIFNTFQEAVFSCEDRDVGTCRCTPNDFLAQDIEEAVREEQDAKGR